MDSRSSEQLSVNIESAQERVIRLTRGEIPEKALGQQDADLGGSGGEGFHPGGQESKHPLHANEGK